MNSQKLYFGLIGVLIVITIGFVASARQAVTVLQHRSGILVNLKAKNQAADNQENQLIRDKQDIATYAELNTIAQSVVPQDKDQAQAVRGIVNLAAQSGISQLSSITFPPSTLGGSTKPGSKLTQVMAVKGIPGVYDLQITVTQDNTSLVPYEDFITFLSKLEQNRRTAQVSSISVEPDQKHPDMIAFTLQIDEFIRP
ncbi:MAG TPA: hypothetical protein VGS08_04200 [Candidatus Saccharimonadales bacterium]|nr:hypothetical protein [Candidatus Saccharimonadales bacterium]